MRVRVYEDFAKLVKHHGGPGILLLWFVDIYYCINEMFTYPQKTHAYDSGCHAEKKTLPNLQAYLIA